ncbi:hypothetical protein IFT88_07015 [Frigoribacterium sp. CFBP 8751]|nr:hypothetical protein [Frigoribacterium sp. CFBP 8751]
MLLPDTRDGLGIGSISAAFDDDREGRLGYEVGRSVGKTLLLRQELFVGVQTGLALRYFLEQGAGITDQRPSTLVRMETGDGDAPTA